MNPNAPPEELFAVVSTSGVDVADDRERAAELYAHVKSANPALEIAMHRYELALVRAQRAIPLNALWLDAEAVGVMLSAPARVVRERLAARKDFPRASRIGERAARWNAAEINDWMQQQRGTVRRRRSTEFA